MSMYSMRDNYLMLISIDDYINVSPVVNNSSYISNCWFIFEQDRHDLKMNPREENIRPSRNNYNYSSETIKMPVINNN